MSCVVALLSALVVSVAGDEDDNGNDITDSVVTSSLSPRVWNNTIFLQLVLPKASTYRGSYYCTDSCYYIYM